MKLSIHHIVAPAVWGFSWLSHPVRGKYGISLYLGHRQIAVSLSETSGW